MQFVPSRLRAVTGTWTSGECPAVCIGTDNAVFCGNNRRSGGSGFSGVLITRARVRPGDSTARAAKGIALAAWASLSNATSGPLRAGRADRTIAPAANMPARTRRIKWLSNALNAGLAHRLRLAGGSSPDLRASRRLTAPGDRRILTALPRNRQSGLTARNQRRTCAHPRCRRIFYARIGRALSTCFLWWAVRGSRKARRSSGRSVNRAPSATPFDSGLAVTHYQRTAP